MIETFINVAFALILVFIVRKGIKVKNEAEYLIYIVFMIVSFNLLADRGIVFAVVTIIIIFMDLFRNIYKEDNQ